MRQADTTAFINRYLADPWKAEKITPAPRCTDEEFIRRTRPDIIERIAIPDEVQAFTKVISLCWPIDPSIFEQGKKKPHEQERMLADGSNGRKGTQVGPRIRTSRSPEVG